MENEVNLNDSDNPASTEPVEVNHMENAMDHAPSTSDYSALESTESREETKPQKLTGFLHTEAYIYREDVVKCCNHEGMLGVVMEVPGDSDSESSSTDESDIEDGEDGAGDGDGNDSSTKEGTGNSREKSDSLADGQIRVMWLDGSETTNSLSDVTIIDRGFLHGDIVASVADPTGQLGLVLDVNILVYLLSPTGEVIKNVSSRDLKRFREFTVGDYVVNGPWLGRVEEVVDNVTVLFDDGSVCKVMKADPLRLKPVLKSIADDTGFPYYPGQRVRAASSSVFKGSRWLSGLWKANRLEGTVTKVQAGSVFVYWIASTNPGVGTNQATVPSEEQNPKNLTLLSCFAHANWQLGEWCLLSGNNTIARNNNLEVNDQQALNVLNPDETNLDESKNNELQTVDDRKELVSPHTENGFSANPSPDDGLKGILRGPSIDLHKDMKPEVCNASAEPDSCGGTSAGLKEPARESWPAFRKKLRKVFFKREKKGHRRDEPFERAFLIVNITTNVDVVWQDGTREFGLDSKSLVPINSPGDHEFFPEQYVIEKALNEGDDSSEVKRVGIVRSVNAKERTAYIRWLKPVSRPEDPQEFDDEELVSSYELDEHPDYDYCYGDVVVRLSPACISATSTASDSTPEEQEDHNNSVEEENGMNMDSCHDGDQASNGEPHLDVSSLSWVGHITGLKDGDIEVTWGDGMVSKVGPQAIYVVGREDDGESFDGGSEYSDAASWETVGENEIDAVDAAEEESGLHPSTENSIQREDSSASLPEDCDISQPVPLSSAVELVKSPASGFLSQGKEQMDLLAFDDKNLNESELQENASLSVNGIATDNLNTQESSTVDYHGIHSSTAIAYACSLETTAADDEVSMLDNSSKYTSNETCIESGGAYDEVGSYNFKHFDITKDPLDHHFLGGSGQTNGGRKWIKKIQQEWNILEKNLPDAIYVRFYEDRMNLLRAVIVGACGTPYQDGLFFFDFYLPPEYPEVPPSAYYHSGGLRVNPNLYEDGKVCLSLLNTWTGRGNEVWDPSSSSILQVLVSLQGLVLNSKPYFNEAGYEKQIGTVEGEKNYLPYNENTFLLNLKSMMYLIRRPPMHFEEFVKDHFRRRGHYILKACDTYMKGCLVGSLTKDACMSDESKGHSCSVGFKLMLNKIIPRLLMALNEVGADCQQFENLGKS